MHRALLVLAVLALLPLPPSVQATGRPDIILVVTDDMRSADWAALPQTQALIGGTTLPNYILTTALCCPSRASMLTGLYAHTHGVKGNGKRGKPGGWKAFRRHESTALPTHLADYDTALIGKYLNGYEKGDPTPPGWDVWEPTLGKPSYQWRDGYITDVARDLAVGFLSDGDPDPKFLWFGAWAPHPPAKPAARHKGAFPEKKGLDGDRLRSLLAVDEAVAAMYAVAKPDTVWVVVSDNGYVINEKGYTGKNVPLDGAHRVTALARIPGLTGGTDERIVANIDLFATLITAAGYTPPPSDGLPWQENWSRDSIPIEGWAARKGQVTYAGTWSPEGIVLEHRKKRKR